MVTVTLKQLLEAGAHFGHQTNRWNPKMKPYIFTSRNGIHIIDLQKTAKLFTEACEFITKVVEDGGKIIFVGTKRQAQESIEEEAKRCGMPYVNRRWLGGTLTNFKTISKSIEKLRKLEELSKDEEFMSKLSKKDRAKFEKKLQKLRKNFGGIKDLYDLPQALFVVDIKKEYIAVHEARKMGIPTVALVDTNCDPEEVDYVVPANDDAIRTIKLFSSLVADACLEGLKRKEEKEMAEEKAEGEVLAETEQEREEEALA